VCLVDACVFLDSGSDARRRRGGLGDRRRERGNREAHARAHGGVAERQIGRQIDTDTYKQIKVKDTEIDTDIVTQTRTSLSA